MDQLSGCSQLRVHCQTSCGVYTMSDLSILVWPTAGKVPYRLAHWHVCHLRTSREALLKDSIVGVSREHPLMSTEILYPHEFAALCLQTVDRWDGVWRLVTHSQVRLPVLGNQSFCIGVN